MSKKYLELTQEQVDQMLQSLENTRTKIVNQISQPIESTKPKIGEECLLQALNIINGKRVEDYGTPEDSFSRIADYWENYLRHTNLLNTDASVLPKDVAIMMVLFKIARLEHSYTHDSCVDICGYTAIYDNMFDRGK